MLRERGLRVDEPENEENVEERRRKGERGENERERKSTPISTPTGLKAGLSDHAESLTTYDNVSARLTPHGYYYWGTIPLKFNTLPSCLT